MAGRLSGIFVSKVLKPRTMIAASLVGCLAASIILVIWGASSAIGVYIGTCKCRSWYTPSRTPRISGLKSQILKPTFLS